MLWRSSLPDARHAALTEDHLYELESVQPLAECLTTYLKVLLDRLFGVDVSEEGHRLVEHALALQGLGLPTIEAGSFSLGWAVWIWWWSCPGICTVIIWECASLFWQAWQVMNHHLYFWPLQVTGVTQVEQLVDDGSLVASIRTAEERESGHEVLQRKYGFLSVFCVFGVCQLKDSSGPEPDQRTKLEKAFEVNAGLTLRPWLQVLIKLRNQLELVSIEVVLNFVLGTWSEFCTIYLEVCFKHLALS